MAGNWRLLSSVVVGTLIASAILSTTAIYADAIRDLGLQHALQQEPASSLDVRVSQSNVNVGANTYQASQGRIDRAVAAALGGARSGQVRQGLSATFYPAPAGQRANLGDPDRPRANLYFRSDIESHIDVVAGTLPPVMPDASDAPIPADLGAETAQRLGIKVGDRFDLFPYWDEHAPPVQVQVVGLVRATDLTDRYWGGVTDLVDAKQRSWETLDLLVPEATFFGGMTAHLPTVTADYASTYQVRFDHLNSRNARPVADALSRLEQTLSATETRAQVDTDLVQVLRTYDQKLFFTRIPLLILLLQIGGIVAYYLVMVSTMLIERQAAEIATLRSRGATTPQLLAQYAVEGLILAGLAGLAGPPIAAAVISALGPTPAFSALSGGGPLPVHVSSAAYVLAGIGALIAFAALMVPAWRATRTTMVEFKRATARPRPTPLFLRYYLDVALVLIVAIVFWRLSRQPHLFSQGLFGDTRADPFLLTTPAVFMLTVGIVFLRLFPLALRGVAWLVGRTRSVAVLVGMRSLTRNPTHYTRLILLLMFATGIGLFAATFSATLGRSYSDRAAYGVGADVRADQFRGAPAGDVAFVQAVDAIPADVRSPVIRTSGFITTTAATVTTDVLGVDPATFGKVAYFRGDFAPQSLSSMLDTLAQNEAHLQGVPLPVDARQVGVWVQVTDIRGPLSLGLGLQDATGRTINIALGDVRPGDDATQGWRFFTADLQHGLGRFGGALRAAPLTPPITIRSFYVSTNSRIGAQRGAMLIGPALATPAAPPTEDGQTRDLASPFPGAVQVTDFSAPTFEVMQDLVPRTLGDQARPEPSNPAPGAAASISYSWLDAGRSPATRGLRQHTDGQPVVFYLSRPDAAQLGLRPGDTTTLTVSGHFLAAKLAGVFDYFPTYDVAQSRDAFAVVDASRLIAAANASTPDRPVLYSEAWFATHDPGATRRAAVDQLGAQTVDDIVSAQAAQQSDPLVAAGWSGILAIAFGAVLLLSAIGFVVYSYLTAQERSLEFAILRTLGFSRPQIFVQVAFEHLLVIAAGMGLGSLVGVQIGRYMMRFLATDERGLQVLPPFLLSVSWPQVFLVWAILGGVFMVTVGAVVLLYFRLAVHRALRIGDV